MRTGGWGTICTSSYAADARTSADGDCRVWRNCAVTRQTGVASGECRRRRVDVLVVRVHRRGAFDLGVELVEPHRPSLPARHQKSQRNRSKTVGKPLIEHRSVGVVHYHPMVALGTNGNVGKVERSQHVGIHEQKACHIPFPGPDNPDRPPSAHG